MMLPSYHEEGELKDHGKGAGRGGLGCRQFCSNIFREQESRSIFFFLLLTLGFAFVELFYGLLSNSLGLISDAFHMFFDCSALVAGLVASVMARRPANERYSYGYQRAEVLGGFINALFLVFIAFFIFKEALERFFDPPHVHSHRLVTVSVLGLLVNLIGIFAFSHAHSHGGGGAHGHSHGASSHGHSHGNGAACDSHHGHSHSNGGYGGNHSGHSHDNGHHGHSHDNTFISMPSAGHDSAPKRRSLVLDGVLLHVIADTLGSVGVITSSLLIHQFGWMVADPVCSIFMSLLIFFSTMPLLRNSCEILMQRTPQHIEPVLYRCYRMVNAVEGVISYREPHFWSLSSNYVVGSLAVVIKNTANDTAVRNSVQRIFLDAGINKMVVQVERF